MSLYRVLYHVIRIKAAEGMNMRNNSFVIDDVVIAFKEREYKWTFDDKWSSANAREELDYESYFHEGLISKVSYLVTKLWA